jgi:predicted acyltransferase
MTKIVSQTLRPKRAYAVDALRGIAILGMVLSGVIPYSVLPTWMYHSQEPPPTHQYNINISGLTWVDLVFPIFLFTMGVAIPLALSNRIANGWNRNKIILFILKRGFLLASFAIYLQHIRPFQLNPSPNTDTWWIALIGFIILFLMYVRLPKYIPNNIKRIIPIIGWLSAAIFLSLLKYPDGKGFSLEKSDIILLLLTNAAVFASLIWFFTRQNLLFRVGFLGFLMALKLSAKTGSWVSILWGFSPLPWLFKFEYLAYLFLVIPGTIVGDLLLNWMKKSSVKESDEVTDNWDKLYLIILVCSMVAICLVLLIGLQSRLVLPTTIVVGILCFLVGLLLEQPTNVNEKLITNMYKWGVYWLILGLLLEPYEGGIKKDPPTMSYFFITAGISIFLLISLFIIIDVFHQRRWLQFFIDNGQNPMIGYVSVANFIWPTLGITGAYNWIIENTKTTELGLVRGISYTILLGLFVQLCTRLKIFWRT